ncbi:MAG TPA: aminotransferase class IV [Myxococcales bacterium]|jgi:branched-chain amino acid aminotransferase|nr:aminotransferase class IV [Myxococcales bacterium]
MATLLNVEGRLVPPEQAFVPVMDRGFLYGDSVYEVVRTYGGRVFELGRHLDRMERSAARIGLSLPPRARLESELFRTIDAAGNAESYARIIVTRGEGQFGLSPHLAEGLNRLIFMVRPLELPAPEQYERGLQMAVTRTRRNPPQALDPALKTGNYLNSALALRESHAAGADDALLLDLRGQVTEASTSNVFFVQDGVVVTPPLVLGMLEGVTRGLVIEIARGEGLLVREEPHGPEALAAADEVFVTSTIREAMAVTSLLLLDGEKPDRRVVAGGKPGPITRRLHAAFRRYVERTHRR